ncbi:MAG: M4 family metallopeptidase [Lysobacter sp.]|nr:M4 family metallopeptidase [Lysobacter sp.]
MSQLAKALSVALLAGVAGHAAAADTVVDRALTAIRNNPVATRLSTSDTFTTAGITVDKNGTEHVRFKRTYRAVPVIGGDIVVHSRAGVFKSASLTQAKALTLSTTPTLTSAQAIAKAGAQFGTKFDAAPTSRLVIYARPATPRLAYDVLYVGAKTDGTPTRMHYYVDAATGAILDKEDAIHTGTLPGTGYPTGNTPPPPDTTPAIGSGRSLMGGTVPLNTLWNNTRRVYELKDSTRGNTYVTDMGNGYRGTGTLVVDTDNKWGNGTQQDRASAAVDAAYGFAKTWDFYKSKFNRAGIAGDGKGSFGAVHYSLRYNNAFWNNDCFCMSFGDGDGVNLKPLVAIDIMGHEVSHGVTHASADLIYSKESGGLNEATSDILGTMVEFFANNANQPPNYFIGDTIFVQQGPGGWIRSMFKPSMDGISDDCYPDGSNPSYLNFFSNAKDPHYTSGVANHFFYLLAEGAVVPTGPLVPADLGPSDLVCNGNVGLAGIGREAAVQIWYRALTVYMVSTTNYAGARAATMSAAADLYGASSSQQNAVAAAWDAVGVH